MRKLFMLAIIFLLTACSSLSNSNAHLTEIETEVFQLLDVEAAYSTIDQLSEQPRIAGTTSEKNAADFISDKLASFGYEVEMQKFEFDDYTFPSLTELIVDNNTQSFSPAPFNFSKSGDIKGEIVYAHKGELVDFEKIDIAGKIALVQVDELEAKDIVKHGKEAGAIGVIMFVKEEMAIDGWSLDSPEYALIPAVTLSNEEGLILQELVEKEEHITGNLTIEGAHNEVKTSQNIVVTKLAENEGTDLVIVGAHYDSVEDSPGASDNASGTAVLLEIAKAIKDIKNENEVKLVFFGAEEIGMLGSRNYVNEMNGNDIDRTIAMLNMDMVGSADAGNLSIFTVDGDKNEATETSSRVYNDLFDAKLLLDATDRSDHAAFHEAGIDAALLSYFPLEDWYHSPEDTIEKISKTKVLDVAQTVLKSILELSMPNVLND